MGVLLSILVTVFSLAASAGPVFPEDDQQFYSQPAIAGLRVLAGVVGNAIRTDSFFESVEPNDVDQQPVLASARRFCWSQGFYDAQSGNGESISGNGWDGTGVTGLFSQATRTKTLYANVDFNKSQNRLLANVKCRGRATAPPQSRIQLFRTADRSFNVQGTYLVARGMLFGRSYDENDRGNLESSAVGASVLGAARRYCKSKGFDDAIGYRTRGLRSDELECTDTECYYDSDGFETCDCYEYDSKYDIAEFTVEDVIGRYPYFTSSSYPDVLDSATCYSQVSSPEPTYLNPIGQLEVLNAATLNSSIGTYSVITIKGSNLSVSTGTATGADLPTNLVGTTVLVNKQALGLLYVSPTQINAFLPNTLDANQTYDLEVYSQNRLVGVGRITLLDGAPGVYSVSVNNRAYAKGAYSLDGGANFTEPIAQDGQVFEVPVQVGTSNQVRIFGTDFHHIAAEALGNGVFVNGTRAPLISYEKIPSNPSLEQATFEIPDSEKTSGDLEIRVRSYGVDSTATYIRVKLVTDPSKGSSATRGSKRYKKASAEEVKKKSKSPSDVRTTPDEKRIPSGR